MLKLNLVSEELKKDIKLRRIYGIFKRISCYFLIITIVYSITLLLSHIMLSNKFEETVEQTTLIAKNTQSYNSRIEEINSQVDFISEAQKNFLELSCFLKKIDSFAAGQLTIGEIKFAKDKGMVVIAGKATSRNGLLIFKSKLDQSGYFSKVDLPLKDLLTKDNIDFQIAAQVNLAGLQ